MLPTFSSSLLLFVLLPTAQAFSSGAGACLAGRTSVGHSGAAQTLQSGNYAVKINGKSAPIGGEITISGDSTFEIQLSGPTFKGVLLRVGNTAFADVTTTDGSLKQSDQCLTSQVGGITHQSSVSKTRASAIVDPATAEGTFPVDISVVQSNSGGQSVHFYGAVTVKLVKAGRFATLIELLFYQLTFLDASSNTFSSASQHRKLPAWPRFSNQ